MLRRKARWLVPAVATLAALVPISSATAATTVAPDQYVALGDSAAAGPLLQPQVPFAVQGNCQRSTSNYANILKTWRAAALTDVTCSGATTASIYQTQLGWVNSATRHVTITFGANDVNIVNYFGCYSVPGSCASNQPNLLAQLSNAMPYWEGLLQAIHARAPYAQVIVVGYGAKMSPGTCNAGISQSDIAEMQSVVDAMNYDLSVAAAQSQAAFANVGAYATGHDECQPEGVRWWEPFQTSSDAVPLHPTHLGMLATASVINGLWS